MHSFVLKVAKSNDLSDLSIFYDYNDQSNVSVVERPIKGLQTKLVKAISTTEPNGCTNHSLDLSKDHSLPHLR